MYHRRLRDKKALEVIDYEIFDYSSQASSYHPENIKVDDPQDPNSRWSTVTNDHRQFIILKVEESVVGTITFGKFSKIHVCNVKEMKISVSYDNKEYVEVFYGGLRNDTESETFTLSTTIKGKMLVTRFVKIEPLAAWGMNFNYSIWYVGLKGLLEVRELVERLREMEKKEILRISLRNLRRLGYHKEIEGIRVEEYSPLLNRVKELLEKKAFEECEEFILSLDDSVFDKFVEKSGYLCKWEEVEKKGAWPCERGGHQMVSQGGRIFLYGGWNGIEELEDFWVYDGERWECLVSEEDGGPGKRSCHKMTTDGRRIFLLGKYVSSVNTQPVENEVWAWEGRWSLLRSKEKIPSNTYDHSVSFGNGTIYSFGGKQTDDEETYGGLYRVDVQPECSGSFPSRWEVVREDSSQPEGTPILRGRLGHSMVFIPEGFLPGCRFNNSLVIVGGQRGKENFKEIQFYALDTDTVYETIPFPLRTEGRVIQRSILYNEDILLLFTYGKEKDSKLDTFSLFSFSLRYEKWTEITLSHHPLPRSAHQFILNGSSFYLFGGNVLDKRQNDLWRLSLRKPSREDVRTLALSYLKKYKFLDLLDRKREKEAVEYLRKSLRPLLPKESFEKLCLEVFERQDETDPFEEISNLFH